MSHTVENLSEFISISVSRLREEKTKEVLFFFLLCVAINLIGGVDISSRNLLYLDMLGTALAGIALGPWWGASVGLVTNMLLYYLLPTSPSLLVFALVNVFGGLYWGYMCNLKWLKPLEGVNSIRNIFQWIGFKQATWFVAISGGIALSFPVFYILKYILQYIKPGTGFERYYYYMMANVTDKLVCVIMATVVICAFFPALASHLTSEKTQISYGVSRRSIFWFCGLYVVPCGIYLYLYPQHWLFWIIPYVLAVFAFIKTDDDQKSDKPADIKILSISYGALIWLVIISIVVFGMFCYFAINHITPKYDSYHVEGVIKYSNIIADAFSLSLVIALIGVLFLILVQAVKQRERREVLRRVEWVRDRIATDIHNDPLQLVSVLRRKISTVEKNITKIRELIESMKSDSNELEAIEDVEKTLVELNKTFTNYYSVYLPELDESIRKIIRPLSQKDTIDIKQVGLIRKIKDLVDDFSSKNPGITVKQAFKVEEDQLPNKRSDEEYWRIEVVKIIREVLNNVEKHSKADKVYIDVKAGKSKAKRKIYISVSDNGTGFSPDTTGESSTSFGLYEINARAKDIGATIKIDSLYREKVDNKGTIVMLEIPYDY